MNTLRVIGQQQQMRGLFVVLSPHPPKWSHIASVTAVVVLSCWACPAKSTVLHLMDGWVDGRMLLMNYIIIITKWFIELRILSQIGLWLAGWLFVVQVVIDCYVRLAGLTWLTRWPSSIQLNGNTTTSPPHLWLGLLLAGWLIKRVCLTDWLTACVCGVHSSVE